MRWVLTPARAALAGLPVVRLPPGDSADQPRAFTYPGTWNDGWTGVFFALRHPRPYSARQQVSCFSAPPSRRAFRLRRRATELLYMRRTGDNG